jgi:hypothetical protein
MSRASIAAFLLVAESWHIEWAGAEIGMRAGGLVGSIAGSAVVMTEMAFLGAFLGWLGGVSGLDPHAAVRHPRRPSSHPDLPRHRPILERRANQKISAYMRSS